jgi:hypothetical protein
MHILRAVSTVSVFGAKTQTDRHLLHAKCVSLLHGHLFLKCELKPFSASSSRLFFISSRSWGSVCPVVSGSVVVPRAAINARPPKRTGIVASLVSESRPTVVASMPPTRATRDEEPRPEFLRNKEHVEWTDSSKSLMGKIHQHSIAAFHR